MKEKAEAQVRLEEAITQRKQIEEEKEHVMSVLNQEISTVHFKLKQNDMDVRDSLLYCIPIFI